MPAYLMLSSFLVCLSLRVTRAFFGGEEKVVLVFEMIHLFSTFKVFSMVKRLRQSTAFCFKNFVIDSLPLMGGY